jgi:hypothetical protein
MTFPEPCRCSSALLHSALTSCLDRTPPRADPRRGHRPQVGGTTRLVWHASGVACDGDWSAVRDWLCSRGDYALPLDSRLPRTAVRLGPAARLGSRHGCRLVGKKRLDENLVAGLARKAGHERLVAVWVTRLNGRPLARSGRSGESSIGSSSITPRKSKSSVFCVGWHEPCDWTLRESRRSSGSSKSCMDWRDYCSSVGRIMNGWDNSLVGARSCRQLVLLAHPGTPVSCLGRSPVQRLEPLGELISTWSLRITRMKSLEKHEGIN